MLLDHGKTPVPGHQVAIVGLGVVSCCGIGKEAFWEGLFKDPPQGADRLVEDFDPSQLFGPKEARRLDRFTQLSLASALEAFQDAGEPAVDPERCGVVFGSGIGGIASLETQIQVYLEKGAKRVSPFLVPMLMANAAAAGVSLRLGWRGPAEAIVTACASGTHSIGAAARLVASGRCEVAIGGGGEAACTPVGKAAFSNMTALSPTGTSRPFDVRRDGFVMAEGAAALVLEELGHAVDRGAKIYGLLAGAGSSSDAYHITAPAPEGAGALSSMQQALYDAQILPEQVAQINAHGTSTPLNDLAESQAIVKLFGQPGPPVTSIKGVTGHALGAAGALEAVACALSIEHRMIPPTAGLEQLDPEITLDVVTGSGRAWEPGPVLSNSFGFGGHNGCLVISPFAG